MDLTQPKLSKDFLHFCFQLLERRCKTQILHLAVINLGQKRRKTLFQRGSFSLFAGSTCVQPIPQME